jgi:RimJ/RimL family protein N-acetyltransferase
MGLGAALRPEPKTQMSARRALLETPRLRLRVPLPTDLPLLQARVFADAEVMQHVDAGGVPDTGRAAAIFRTLDHEGTGRAPGVLVEKARGEVIGYAGPRLCTVLGAEDFEIGFVLARSAWGRGFGSEIGRAQVAHVLGTLGCPRVLALAAPANTRSIATLLKLGMAFVCRVDIPARGPRNVYAALRPRGPG